MTILNNIQVYYLINSLCDNIIDAGSLMHMEGPTTFQETMGFDSGVLSSVRNKLNKNNFYNFDGLLEAFQHYDKVALKHLDIHESVLSYANYISYL